MVVTESLGVGGTESHLIRLLRPLAARGWDTTVFCITERGGRADQLEAAGIRVLEPPRLVDLRALLRRNPATITLAASRLFWLLRQWRPQIVHFYLPGPYLVGAPLAIATGVPIKVMSRRSLSCYRQRRPLLSRIEPALHGYMDAVIGNSRAVVRELQAEGISSDKINLIYNGIETSAVVPKRLEARRRLGLNPDALVGLMVANLISYKGHTDLIEGLGQVSGSLPAGWRALCRSRSRVPVEVGEIGGGARDRGKCAVPGRIHRRAGTAGGCRFRRFGFTVLQAGQQVRVRYGRGPEGLPCQ